MTDSSAPSSSNPTPTSASATTPVLAPDVDSSVPSSSNPTPTSSSSSTAPVLHAFDPASADPSKGKFGSTRLPRDTKLEALKGNEIAIVSSLFDQLPRKIRKNSISSKTGSVCYGMLYKQIRDLTTISGLNTIQTTELKFAVRAIRSQVKLNQEVRALASVSDLILSPAAKAPLRSFALQGPK